MLMDISAPVELRRVEKAEFGVGRKQAYLTFQNECETEITALHGTVSLLNEGGEVLLRKVFSFTGQSAAPGERFTCHLALDESPAYDRLDAVVEGVEFILGEPWVLIPSRMIDCTPPVLKSGPSRVALVAVAGRDAVCFPEQRDGLWICVCGRFNRWRWRGCRRCARDRDETLEALTPKMVMAEYQTRLLPQRDQQARQRRIRDTDEKAREKANGAAAANRRARAKRIERGIIAAATGVLALSLLVWGALKIFEAQLQEPMAANPSGSPSVVRTDYIDYLETL